MRNMCCSFWSNVNRSQIQLSGPMHYNYKTTSAAAVPSSSHGRGADERGVGASALGRRRRIRVEPNPLKTPKGPPWLFWPLRTPLTPITPSIQPGGRTLSIVVRQRPQIAMGTRKLRRLCATSCADSVSNADAPGSRCTRPVTLLRGRKR